MPRNVVIASQPGGIAFRMARTSAFRIAAAAVLLMAMCLMVRAADEADVWPDEALTIAQIWGWSSISHVLPDRPCGESQIASISEVWDGFYAIEVTPPLYYFLLNRWAWIFGDGEMALRWFSMLCMLGALAVWMTIVRRAGGPVAGITAGLLLASISQREE